MIQIADCYNPLYTDKEHFIILVTGGRGCETPTQGVIMADLTVKQIKDIKEGDFVMGDDFTPRKVLATMHGTSKMYRVHQSSGDDYFVNDGHILTIKKSRAAMNDKGGLTKNGTYRRPNGRYPQYSETTDMNVVEFANQSKHFRSNFRGFKVGSIPFHERPVLIEPYLLGVWLGDGTSIYPQITTPEPEIKAYLTDYAAKSGLQVTLNGKKGKAETLRLAKVGNNPNYFLNKLRGYGLLANKHIPQPYISNSESVRLELLAGLIDTDGYMSNNGYEITQKREELARQIKYIADTLGFRTSITKKKAKIGDKDCGLCYRVLINGDVWRIPCKVERKKVKESDCHKNKDWRLSELTITEEGVGEWCGISLDGNQRYLHADGTVTHNSGKSFSTSTFIERLTFDMGKGDDGALIPHGVLFCRYTMTSAGISVIPEFMEKIEQDGTGRYFSASRTDVVNVATGAKIMFRGIKTSSGNQTAKLKSIHGITTFVVDEAEEWTSSEEFEKIMLSIRQKGIQNRVIIIMNPTDSNHFIYQKYIKDTHKIVEYDGVPVQISTHPSVLHIHTSYLDNIQHLGDEFLKEIQQMKESDPERYAHIVMGKWADVAEGAVFKKWGIVEEFPRLAKSVAVSVDFGFSFDPTAIVKCGIIDNRLYIDEICYKTDMLASDIVRELRPVSEAPDGTRYMVIADSADPRLIQEIANGGILIYAVQKGAGSVLAGITKMKEYEIYVTKRSVNLQEELRNYTWDKDKDGNYINQPIDAYNHCFVGETMVATKDGEKRIIDIREGDVVLTSDGYHKVTRFFNQGVRKAQKTRIYFDGFFVEVTATPDHKIKTQNEWKELSKIKKGDILFIKSSMVNATINTKESGITEKETKSCIESFGSFTMEESPKATKSTTKTETPTITALQTSKCSIQPTIRDYTQKYTSKTRNIWRRLAKTWTRLVSKRISGTNQQKEELGTLNTPNSLNERTSRVYVNIAERRFYPKYQQQNFAQTAVKQHTDTTMGRTTRSVSVRGAEQNLSLIDTQVQSSARVLAPDNIPLPCVVRGVEILSEGFYPVFDIEVEDVHEFYANGILVSNCVDASRYYVLGKLLGQIQNYTRVRPEEINIF